MARLQMGAAYYREYRKKRIPVRRKQALQYLGGKCAKCSSKTTLEFDHIDRTKKRFTITTRLWEYSWARIEKELDKCQLLCKRCHIAKTLAERGQVAARGTHGTVSAYLHCGPPKCEPCKAAKRVFQQVRRAKLKAAVA